jgi:hypothetical protein
MLHDRPVIDPVFLDTFPCRSSYSVHCPLKEIKKQNAMVVTAANTYAAALSRLRSLIHEAHLWQETVRDDHVPLSA